MDERIILLPLNVLRLLYVWLHLIAAKHAMLFDFLRKEYENFTAAQQIA